MRNKPYYKCIRLDKASEKKHYNINATFGTNNICKALTYEDYTHLPVIKRVVDVMFLKEYPTNFLDLTRPLMVWENAYIKTLVRRENHLEYFVIMTMTVLKKITENQDMLDWFVSKAILGEEVTFTSYKYNSKHERVFLAKNSSYIGILQHIYDAFLNFHKPSVKTTILQGSEYYDLFIVGAVDFARTLSKMNKVYSKQKPANTVVKFVELDGTVFKKTLKAN